MFDVVAMNTAGGQMLAMASNGDANSIGLLLFLSGFVFYGLMYLRYRNTNKRHMHAKETTAEIDNVRAADNFVARRTRLRNRRIQGANERQIEGAQNTGLGAGLGAGLVDGASVRSIGRMFTQR